MKKIILLLTAFLVSDAALAIEAMVTVLETPLFKEKDINSEIYQYARKGDIIYINNKHIDRTYLGQYRAELTEDNTQNFDRDEYEQFYTTTDRIGRTAYIIRNHVKLIYKDLRETSDPVTTYKRDKTDYIPDGRLSDVYPFKESEYRRSGIAFGIGNKNSESYPYPHNIAGEDIGVNFALNWFGLWPVDFDPAKRTRFGVRSTINYYQNKFQLVDAFDTKETHLEVDAGPYLSYDFYRTEKFALEINGGISLGYHMQQVAQDSDDNYRDRRIYDGIYFAGIIGSSARIRNVFGNVDFILGVDLSAVLPYKLKDGGRKHEDALWDMENDEISYEFDLNLDTFLGFSINF